MEKEFQFVLHLDGVNVYLPAGSFKRPNLGSIWKHGGGHYGKSFKFHKNGILLNLGGKDGELYGNIKKGNLFNVNGIKGSFDILYEVLESIDADFDLIHIQQFEVALTVLNSDIESNVFERFQKRILKEDYQNGFGGYYPEGKKNERSSICLDSFVCTGERVYNRPEGITAAALGIEGGKKIVYRALRAEIVVSNKGKEPKTFQQLEDIFLSNLISSITVKILTTMKGIKFKKIPERDEFKYEKDWLCALTAVTALDYARSKREIKRYEAQLKTANKGRVKPDPMNEYEDIRSKMVRVLEGV